MQLLNDPLFNIIKKSEISQLFILNSGTRADNRVFLDKPGHRITCKTILTTPFPYDEPKPPFPYDGEYSQNLGEYSQCTHGRAVYHEN